MEPITQSSPVTGSAHHLGWLWMVIAFLLGGAVGYGVFTYLAPNADEIEQRLQVEVDHAWSLSTGSITGTIQEIQEDSFVVAVTTPSGEVAEYTFSVTEDTEFVTRVREEEVPGEMEISTVLVEYPGGVVEGAQVAVTAAGSLEDSSNQVDAVQVLIF